MTFAGGSRRRSQPVGLSSERHAISRSSHPVDSDASSSRRHRATGARVATNARGYVVRACTCRQQTARRGSRVRERSRQRDRARLSYACKRSAGRPGGFALQVTDARASSQPSRAVCHDAAHDVTRAYPSGMSHGLRPVCLEWRDRERGTGDLTKYFSRFRVMTRSRPLDSLSYDPRDRAADAAERATHESETEMNAIHSSETMSDFVSALVRKAQRVGIFPAVSDSSEGVTRGVYRARVNRTTGAVLVIVDTSKLPRIQRVRSRWYSVCASHGQYVAQSTRQDAYDDLAEPLFCSRCAHALGLDADRRSRAARRDAATA